ncbi:hypothetical protein QUF63_06740 [Anaerolineales bacterium HSG25]|nr:hypothetical protein [Anaerolineales bacterium HSG25]
MKYSINLDGLEVGQTYVEPAGLFSGPKLIQHGELAPKGEKRGEMILYRADGSSMVAKFKHPFLDQIPQLTG